MTFTRRLIGRLAVALALAASPLAAHAQDAGGQMMMKKDAGGDSGSLVVFAAASLKNALDAIGKDFEKESGVAIKASYAASSALAKQIEQAAPADVFISADVPWMDYVAQKKLIVADTRHDLLGNRLVVVAGPGYKGGEIELKDGVDIEGLLGEGRLAMGDPSAVPAGKYGKAAFEKLGVWDKVSPRVAGAENVRAALALVSRGEAPLGVVYKTDAAADPSVKIVGTFPENTHPKIIYPAAKLASSKNASADAFLKYLSGPSAKKQFEAAGFTVLSSGS